MAARRLDFVKMHGLGNDYVLFDADRTDLGGVDLSELSGQVCRRRFSVGGDGIIVLSAADGEADFTMRVFNPDGSETGACGTAFRCAARYVYERRGFEKAADGGVRIATSVRNVLAKVILPGDGGPPLFEVSMGKALFKRREIPVAGDPEDEFLMQPLRILGKDVTVSAVSVGNPHAIVFCDDLRDADVETLGPALETHQAFPQRTNVQFVQVLSPHEIRVGIWERGTGTTLCCGTGACASVAVAKRLSMVETPVLVRMPGGELEIHVETDGDLVMIARAEFSYTGWLEYEA